MSCADGGGRNALRLQLMHVRTTGVLRMKDVIEQRAVVRPDTLSALGRQMQERKGTYATHARSDTSRW